MTSTQLVVRCTIGLVILAAIAYALSHINDFDADAIKRTVALLGWWGPVVYVAFGFVTVALLGSVSVTALVGGAAFGIEAGIALAWIGTMAGASFNLFVGRYLFADLIARRAGNRLRFVLDGVASEGWRCVTFIRLVPFSSFAAVSYLFGVTPVRWHHYFIPTALCVLPGLVAFAWLGQAGRDAAEDSGDLIQNGLMASGLLAIVIAIPSVVVRNRRRRSGVSRRQLDELVATDSDLMVAYIQSAGEPDQPLPFPNAEIIAESNVPQWARRCAVHPERRIVVIHRQDRGALVAIRALETSGVIGPRYLIDGPATLNRR
ncbi:MAG: TVP38/TMEM64 family protein [Alphaproteobacteria bacterium]|nr:TVP38/TMEM64 family protein [Alphaproteobacteria bacterium]